MNSKVAYAFIGAKRIFICLSVMLAMVCQDNFNAQAFDGSDVEIPRLEQMTLANVNQLNPDEPVAIVIKTSDDKNWVKLEGTLNLGFSYRIIPNRNTPPNCATGTTTFSRLEPIEILSKRSISANNRKYQTFWLVGFLPAKKELVTNCAEYRDLTLPPIVTVNSSSFKSVTPRGSTIPIVTGGIFTPKLTDESGRFAPSVQIQSIQESQFWPKNNNYLQSKTCLTYAESSIFREKNKAVLDSYEAEVKAARDLNNSDLEQIIEPVKMNFRQIDSWLEFVVEPNMDKLKAIPTCSAASGPSVILNSINDVKLKIKSSNALLVKANLTKRCEFYQAKFLKLEQKILDSRTQFLGTAAIGTFENFTYLSLKVDCSSAQITSSLLDTKESGLIRADSDLNEKIQLAISQVICKPFNARLYALSNAYNNAYQKFAGSRFENKFKEIDFRVMFSACETLPLDISSIDLMKIDFEAFVSIFSINLEDAEKLLKAKKLTFRIKCTKSSVTKVLTNKTGKCPSGYSRLM